MTTESRSWAVVPAAGLGERMGAGIPKQYLELGSSTVIQHTLDVLLGHSAIAGVVVALAPTDRWWQSLLLDYEKPVITTSGGSSRPESVLNALERLRLVARSEDYVMVHDAARPCLQSGDIDRLVVRATETDDGAFLGVRASDTLHQSEGSLRVDASIDRSEVWQAQTPQMFGLMKLTDALSSALQRGQRVTDEVSAMLFAGFHPAIVEGHRDNIKITQPEDMALAEYFLKAQHRI